MRDIKFRAWNVEDKIMHSVAFPSWNGTIEVWQDNKPQSRIQHLSQNGPEEQGILMQSTGLTDKNGKEEVYADDDIYFSTSQTQHYKGYVKWSEKGLCYVVECYWQKQDEIPHLCDGFEMKYEYKNTCVMRLDSECSDIEIIGTIHDKPLETNNETV